MPSSTRATSSRPCSKVPLQPLVDDRLQPPEPRRGGFRSPLPSLISVSTLEIIAFNRGSPAQYGGTRPRRMEAVCRARRADRAPCQISQRLPLAGSTFRAVRKRQSTAASRAGCAHADADKGFCEALTICRETLPPRSAASAPRTPGHPELARPPSPLAHLPQQRGPIVGCRLTGRDQPRVRDSVSEP
jgi:hypothetical protein